MTETYLSQQVMLESLINFYKQGNNFGKFIDIIVHKKYKIPISLFDWFITNYAKNTDIHYIIARPNGETEIFKPYRSYQNQLNSFSKKNFDPFCRGGAKNNITLQYTDPITKENITFETSIRQMKFFKWAIENLIVEYIYERYEDLTNLMKEYRKSLMIVPVVQQTTLSN